MEDIKNGLDVSLMTRLELNKNLKLFKADWIRKKRRSRIKLSMPSKKKRKAYYNKCMSFKEFLEKYYIETKKDDYIPTRNNVYRIDENGDYHYSNSYTLRKYEVWNEYYEYRRSKNV